MRVLEGVVHAQHAVARGGVPVGGRADRRHARTQVAAAVARDAGLHERLQSPALADLEVPTQTRHDGQRRDVRGQTRLQDVLELEVEEAERHRQREGEAGAPRAPFTAVRAVRAVGAVLGDAALAQPPLEGQRIDLHGAPRDLVDAGAEPVREREVRLRQLRFAQRYRLRDGGRRERTAEQAAEQRDGGPEAHQPCGASPSIGAAKGSSPSIRRRIRSGATRWQ